MKFSVLLMALVTSFSLNSLAGTAPLVCLFTETNYSGAHFCFNPGQMPPDLDAFPLSDGSYTNGEFGSIRVDGGANVDIYDSTDYGTSSVEPMNITESVPDLSTIWNTTIFSINVR